MSTSERSSVISAVGGFVAFWLCIIFLFAAQISLGTGQPLVQGLRGGLVLWLPWLVVSPLMVLMGFVLPLGTPLWKFLPGHIAACMLILFPAGWLSRNILPQPPLHGQPAAGSAEGMVAPPPGGVPLGPLGSGGRPPGGGPEEAGQMGNFFRSMPIGLPLYTTAVLLVGVLRLRRTALEKERQALELERQLSRAKLKTLRSQLQPHFLFNTLNTLASLVHSDPDKAEDILVNLSTLLRATLETKDRTLIPLRQELSLARDYLAIQQARYGDRLIIKDRIPAEVLSCAVPPLILQPALENAIKHAVDPNPAGATIRLKAQRVGDKLIIDVEDSGAGASSGIRSGHGVGVANIGARLKASFPKASASFNLLPNQHGGITARYEIPALASQGEIDRSISISRSRSRP
ncbi:hypothetical protein BH09VER1_BH09VER1_39460 [soil metagenome]